MLVVLFTLLVGATPLVFNPEENELVLAVLFALPVLNPVVGLTLVVFTIDDTGSTVELLTEDDTGGTVVVLTDDVEKISVALELLDIALLLLGFVEVV